MKEVITKRIEQLLTDLPEVRNLSATWAPIPIGVIKDPMLESLRQRYSYSMELNRMLVRALLCPVKKRFHASWRFEREIMVMSGNVALYSGRLMADYVVRLEFPGIEEKQIGLTGNTVAFSIGYKNKWLADKLFAWCDMQYNSGL